MTDVSVVIPTRDRSSLLALTLRSVLWQQRVATIEVLVVDDGHGQETHALVDATGDSRICVLPNAGSAGVSGARNSGIAAARGAWIAFLDDDDLWAPDKLSAQLAAATETGAAWVYAGDVSVDEELRVLSGSPPPLPRQLIAELRRHNAVPAGASNVMVRADVLKSVGGFDTTLRTSEDWDLWLRLAAKEVPACVPRPLVALRTHHAMASRSVDQMLADVDVIGRRYGLPVDRARHERWAAWMCLETGRRGRALRHYVRAAIRGDIASVGRAAVALIDPDVARHRPACIGSWALEAQAWLNALGPAVNGSRQ